MLAAAAKEADLLSPLINGFVDALLAIWPLWLLIGIVALGNRAYQLSRLCRLSRSGVGEIDRMDGKTFEAFLGTLFRRLGYGVEITRSAGDYGADLVVAKGGRRTAVQAKRWSKRVGVRAIQEAVAAKGYYDCDAALVVANREFTQQARQLARANEVELWDRDGLVRKLLAVRGDAGPPAPGYKMPLESLPEPPVLVVPSDTFAPVPAAPGDTRAVKAVCGTCGVAVSKKVRDYCLTRPGRFGGRIYCFPHQRPHGSRTSADGHPPISSD